MGGTPGPILSLPDGSFVMPNPGVGGLTRITPNLEGGFAVQEIKTRGNSPNTALAGDFDDDGVADDLLVGSSDGIMELFLDEGGELLSEGFLDTDLNISAVALSVIEGSRVFYVTSDGVERAFAFSLDDFVGEERGTVADLTDSTSVAIIAALVAGGGELDGADFFGGSDGETVNFGELLFFSGDGAFEAGTGAGGYTPAEALVRLREMAGRFVAGWAESFGPQGGGWEAIVSAVRGVIETAGDLDVAGFNPFAGWTVVVTHLRLPAVSESLVGALVKAGQAMVPDGPVAAGAVDEAGLREFVFGRPLELFADGFACESFTEHIVAEPAWPEPLVSGWWSLPAEPHTEQLLLACLLAATLWKPEPARDRRPAPELPSGAR
ncbi:MAG: hypothetical protein JNM56_35115, partial [Planctomycetia bacterium]|nr:hypothetical protein [Planctomycetia bacterium]